MLFPNKHIENTDNILTFLPYIPLNFFRFKEVIFSIIFSPKYYKQHIGKGARQYGAPSKYLCFSYMLDKTKNSSK